MFLNPVSIYIIVKIAWKSIFIPVQKIDERHATVIYQFPRAKQRRRRDADELSAKIDLREKGRGMEIKFLADDSTEWSYFYFPRRHHGPLPTRKKDVYPRMKSGTKGGWEWA